MLGSKPSHRFTIRDMYLFSGIYNGHNFCCPSGSMYWSVTLGHLGLIFGGWLPCSSGHTVFHFSYPALHWFFTLWKCTVQRCLDYDHCSKVAFITVSLYVSLVILHGPVSRLALIPHFAFSTKMFRLITVQRLIKLALSFWISLCIITQYACDWYE